MKEITKENIRDRRKNTRIVTELMLKLLPVQILMAAVTAVNGIVSSFFASNFIGVDKRRAYLSGLCMEEMAGNVVEFGFAKDKKKHAINIRVVHKNDGILMRIRDDCAPFDPDERRQLTDPADDMKNAGIRMVYRIARSVEYQNILGMNVLTIRI